MSWFDIRSYTFRPYPRRGIYETISVDTPSRKVEITCSPNGRVTHVYVDGQEIPRHA